VALHVDDEVHAKARRHFDDAALIEMTHLVGLYTGVAMIVALARPAFDRYRPGPPITTTS
jgi:4-carboxymuconolactone decarboxylase